VDKQVGNAKPVGQVVNVPSDLQLFPGKVSLGFGF